jgi:tricorn protease interacting factor F2/3
MINAFVTDNVFREGLHQYLENFKYRNASGSDLWEFISKVSDRPVRKVMESFIQNIGYPVIEIREDDGKLKLNQYRFLLNGKKQNAQWKIPLTMKYTSGIRSQIFDSDSTEIDDARGFIKLNDSETGFYRVMYSDSLYENIIKNIAILDNKDIFGILNDLHAFLLAGKISFKDYLSRTSKFMELSDPLIIREISNELFSLYSIYPENRDIVNANMEYLSSRLKAMGERRENENINISLARGVLANRYAIINRGYAEELSRFEKSLGETDPNMRLAVLTSMAIVHNDAGLMLDTLEGFDQDEDRVKVIQAMAMLNGEDNFRTIEDAIKNRKIKMQDSLRYYMLAATNPGAREYIYSNLEDIIENIQTVFAGSGYSSRVIETVVPFIGLNHRDEIQEKLDRINIREISRGIKKGMEYLNIYINFREKMQQN